MIQQRIIRSPNSLIKYGNPFVVSKKEKSQGKREMNFVLKPEKDKRQLGMDVAKQTEELLDCVLPPKEWEEEGGVLWRQRVCSDPATRLDVLKLGEQLEMMLKERQAREVGICPVRYELFSQCFDELIRQVTINCLERGLLLIRVRDEMRMTMASYQSLYESSISFGIRKALQAERKKSDCEEQVVALKKEKVALEDEVEGLKVKIGQMERRNEEERAMMEKKHVHIVQSLERTNQQLKAQLEAIIAPKKEVA